MHSSSHYLLGEYLSQRYLSLKNQFNARAFLFGCVQPDKNPVTYFKGSIRFRTIRGHNYPNSCNYIIRLIEQLDTKKSFCVLDYYTLGKLIHYTADAFTYAHNDSFSYPLRLHRIYEKELHTYLTQPVFEKARSKYETKINLKEFFLQLHSEYINIDPSHYVDAQYCIKACEMIMSRLISRAKV